MIEKTGNAESNQVQEKLRRTYVGGRPPIFKTAEEMQEAIDKYFDSRMNNMVTVTKKNGDVMEINQPLPITMSGLAIAIGMSRAALLDYSKKKKFFSTIARARQFVEDFAENMLYAPGVANGASFALRNNHERWEDRKKVDEHSKQEHSGHITNEIVDYTDASPEVPENCQDKIQDI